MVFTSDVEKYSFFVPDIGDYHIILINTYFVLFIKTWNVDNVKRYFDVIGFAFNKEKKHNVNESLNKAVFCLIIIKDDKAFSCKAKRVLERLGIKVLLDSYQTQIRQLKMQPNLWIDSRVEGNSLIAYDKIEWCYVTIKRTSLKYNRFKLNNHHKKVSLSFNTLAALHAIWSYKEQSYKEPALRFWKKIKNQPWEFWT